jgi:hypothetical protein
MPHHIAGRGIANPSLGERAKEPKEGEYNRNRLIWLSVLPKGAQEPLQHPETDPKEISFKEKQNQSGQEMKWCNRQDRVPRFDIAAPSHCSPRTQRQLCDRRKKNPLHAHHGLYSNPNPNLIARNVTITAHKERATTTIHFWPGIFVL